MYSTLLKAGSLSSDVCLSLGRLLKPFSLAEADVSQTVHAEWCGPCKVIAPIYEELSAKHSVPSKVTFTKVDVDSQREIAQRYGVTA